MDMDDSDAEDDASDAPPPPPGPPPPPQHGEVRIFSLFNGFVWYFWSRSSMKGFAGQTQPNRVLKIPLFSLCEHLFNERITNTVRVASERSGLFCRS